MLKKRTFEDNLVDVFSYFVMILMAVSTILPLLNILAKSMSEDWAIISGKVGIFPVGFQLDTIRFVLTSKQFTSSFAVSLFVTGVGTLLSVLMTAIAAYPLSKRHLPGVKSILLIYVFTMLFSGGMIPSYLLMRKLDLINTLAALFLPTMISVFNMLVIKNYFESLPESLEESARLDGANNITVLFKIILPVSTPVLATISLFYAVALWNDYFSPMLYISKPALKTLQVYLREIVMEADTAAAGIDTSFDDAMNVTPEGIRSATILVSTIPIIMIYPSLQKYFIKGIMIGSIKG